MDATYPEEWLNLEEIASILGKTQNAARLWVKRNIPDNFTQSLSRGRGRPEKVVHCSAHERLSSAYDEKHREHMGPDTAEEIRPDDLAMARLRADAVKEYRYRKRFGKEEEAALLTVADWRQNPRTKSWEVEERIGRHRRKINREVKLGGFCVSTLRNWDRYFKGRVTDLVSQRKGNCGRPKSDMPEELLQAIYFEASNGPRACWSRAIKQVRKVWTGPWPNVSDKTLIRRVREFDPEESGLTLGRSGTHAFMQKHMPFIEMDYNKMSLNYEWQIDDMQEDFYCFLGENADKMIERPFVYRIVRCSTRQVIASLASPCQITQAQVQALIGYALCDPSAGIPKRIRFERGTVACSPSFEKLLNDLGIDVSRTSMDGEKGERGIGHSWGKPVIERSNRRHHDLLWRVAGQIGTLERFTAHQKWEIQKKHAMDVYKKTGKQVFLLESHEWPEVLHAAEELSNTTPHSGLPKTLDLETGERRHMTPNEFASTKEETLEVMPESYLMEFFAKSDRVPVTANGFKISNICFGKFDEGLQALAGRMVTVYSLPELVDRAYVVELGRTVEMYQKRKPGESDGQFEKRQRIRKQKMNRHNEMMEKALQNESECLQSYEDTRVHVKENRDTEERKTDAMDERIQKLKKAKEISAQEQDEREFSMDSRQKALSHYLTDDEREEQQLPSNRPSLKEKANRMSGHVEAISETPILEEYDEYDFSLRED